MTTTPPDAPTGPGPHEGPRTTREEVRDLGRLRRSTTDRKIAGVAGGIGRHLDVDPLVIRVALVVLIFFGGAGLLIYGACWLLVPEDDGSEPAFSLDERTRTVALVVVGVLAAAALIGDSWGFIGFPWPVAIAGAIVLYVLTRNRATPGPERDVPPVAGPTYAPGRPPYAAPPPGYVPPTSAAPGYPPYTAAGPTVPGYAAPGHTAPAPTYVPPSYARTTAAPPCNPRKRGPILFWFTLALIAVAEGALGIADLAGAPVADPAYPALALGIVGAMLLVGAFYGRAGGLILLGLIAAIGLTGAVATDRWDDRSVTERPTLASELDDHYGLTTGELVVDLTGVRDLHALDGRTLDLDVNVGRIEVIVPDGLAVDAEATMHGPGAITLFGDERSGLNSSASGSHDPGPGSHPEMTIDADLHVGEIQVRTR